MRDLPCWLAHSKLHCLHHSYEFAPELRKLGVDGEWAGLMPFSKDGRPMVGELCDVGALQRIPTAKRNHCATVITGLPFSVGLKHVHVVVGFGSNGVMSGPHAGRLTGEAAVGRLSDVRTESLPTRLAEALAPCRVDGICTISNRDDL